MLEYNYKRSACLNVFFLMLTFCLACSCAIAADAKLELNEKCLDSPYSLGGHEAQVFLHGKGFSRRTLVLLGKKEIKASYENPTCLILEIPKAKPEQIGTGLTLTVRDGGQTVVRKNAFEYLPFFTWDIKMKDPGGSGDAEFSGFIRGGKSPYVIYARVIKRSKPDEPAIIGIPHILYEDNAAYIAGTFRLQSEEAEVQIVVRDAYDNYACERLSASKIRVSETRPDHELIGAAWDLGIHHPSPVRLPNMPILYLNWQTPPKQVGKHVIVARLNNKGQIIQLIRVTLQAINTVYFSGKDTEQERQIIVFCDAEKAKDRNSLIPISFGYEPVKKKTKYSSPVKNNDFRMNVSPPAKPMDYENKSAAIRARAKKRQEEQKKRLKKR